MANLRGVLAFVSVGLLGGGCIFGDDDDVDHSPFECEVDEDCAHLNDGDACFGPARCVSRSCDRDFRQNATDCQCEYGGHCDDFGFQEQGCNIITCLEHQCGEQIMAEGPSVDQMEGDCVLVQCDGASPRGTEEEDLTDVDNDHNECTVDTCTATGPANDPIADGEHCLDGSGICYGASCYNGCIPQNPTACGAEGPGEPSNNLGGSATQFVNNTSVCGMLDSEDIDWYEMFLDDEAFVADVLIFDFHASAPSIEVCAYVLCHNHAQVPAGEPLGGCSNKVAGPHGSVGCCWEGPPESLSPSWDLDCSNTDEDSGTLYFSVRAPGADTCETYVAGAAY